MVVPERGEPAAYTARTPETGPVAVLLNPIAGHGRFSAEIPAVLAALRETGRPVVTISGDSADAALAAARAAVADGASALVAVGGDGTVHLGLQAVGGTAVAFGAVPAGTGNDFAAGVGMPEAPVPAAHVVADALKAGRTRPVDLARMTDAEGNQRWFGAVLAAGFDSLVNELANRMSFPRGPRRYDIAIVLELLRLRPRPYRIVLDGEPLDVRGVLVAIGNTTSYGGGMKICPGADPTDGLLDVIVGAEMGRLTLMRIKPHLYDGTHVDHPLVTTYRARTVEIGAPGITGYADGERAFP
ncbi:MAG TPA: diacylglycerol kinase family protein, partial [Rugosimonospora sp.]|nr:diacylglycerol kinase family protein [Rugosimonospora sp.]